MASVPEDSPEVTQLAEEGFDVFFARRSLAFSDMNVDNARAILMADREDEEAERAEMEKAQAEAEARQQEEEAKPFKTVNVDYPTNFDPTAGGAAAPKPQQQQKPQGAPTPAKKEDVIFEGTTEELQKLVIESPVPVLLDVCKFRSLCSWLLCVLVSRTFPQLTLFLMQMLTGVALASNSHLPLNKSLSMPGACSVL